ncbi:MAG: hypothetical protein L7W43_04700 [Rubripirellula sp.]|nr:hypothetical protein [Rubripirellula sp.]
MSTKQPMQPCSPSPTQLGLKKIQLRHHHREGAGFLMVIFVTALVVMAFTQTALRSVISERRAEIQRHSTRQLETAIACTSVSAGANRPNKIILPLDTESDERIEVIRDGNTITARWMTGNKERDSLTRTEP